MNGMSQTLTGIGFLPGLVDNKYRYFDLDSKSYTAGEIVSIAGGGVSTWESHVDVVVSMFLGLFAMIWLGYLRVVDRA